jgi:hypothetical protein
MNPETIPSDIYKMLVGKDIPVSRMAQDEIVEEFASACAQMMTDAMGPEQIRKGRLRLSAVGKPDRQIYNDYHGIEGEKLQGATHLKFLFGHLTEAMLLALTKLSGHEVRDEQKACRVAGVRGSMDATIDGHLCDVKSASSYGFKKFKEGRLPYDDPFGYVGQIKAYSHSEKNPKVGWLAMDKQNGTLCWLGYDLDNLSAEMEPLLGYDIVARVEELKKLVGESTPAQCYDAVPDGKSGNMRLSTGCSYCAYKFHCFPKLRTFLYGSGPKYLTTVSREPRVIEVPEDF